MLLLPAPVAAAQSLGPTTGGIGALDQALRFLGHTKRVLMIAAHPDDEDTELLTVLARGHGAEVAYLSLTRGEGGQNLIGDELGAALGVLRSEELLAARALDGARQYFTRVFDFGFSKGLADTWRFWPRDSVLKDVVRIVRRFQPQVIVSVFSGTPRDGHGQHQAAGWAAREAFQAAADSSRFPELAREEGLAAWRPAKLYQSARFDAGGDVLALDGGVLDRAVGQSFLQIAMRGRSLHRSQDMGVAQRLGPSAVRVRLVEDRTGLGGELFAGIDTSLAASLPGSPSAAARAELDAIAIQLRAVTPWNTEALPALRRRLTGLLETEGPRSLPARDQLTRVDAAAALASQVLCDATTQTDRLVPGEPVRVSVVCWNASADTVVVGAGVRGLGGRAIALDGVKLPPGRLASDSALLRVPAEFPVTQPYYLRGPASGALYAWTGERGHWGEPFDPAVLVAEFTLDSGVRFEREVVYRFVDQAIGEVRRPVFVVPRVEVELEPATALWPVNAVPERTFTVRLRHHAADSTEGAVRLRVPTGWAEPEPQPFRLSGFGARATQLFRVAAPRAGAWETATLRVEVVDRAGRRYDAAVERVEYPHVRTRQVARAAESRVALADLQTGEVGRVGYVRGAADRVPEVLATLGLEVVLLPADSLARADLARYRTIVIGPRAYETEAALLAHNARLLAYARAGGSLVVQYQQQAFFRGRFAPAALSLSAGGETSGRTPNPRVAEEDAAVRVLAPGHAAFATPNRLGPGDWAGWVQERGLYFARTWGPEWTPLLELGDTGETPLQGGLLVTRVGRGTYVYTGLSFFRQLPAAVPGAARLFVNLLALR